MRRMNNTQKSKERSGTDGDFRMAVGLLRSEYGRYNRKGRMPLWAKTAGSEKPGERGGYGGTDQRPPGIPITLSNRENR
jgi:hypothetical protein